MADLKKHSYKGHCHCNAVQFNFARSLPLYAPEGEPETDRWKVIRCNCSICTRNGYLLVHPNFEDVNITKGAEKLGEYYFCSKTKPHLFCKECGSSLMIRQPAETLPDGIARYAINLRMVNGIDLNTLLYKDVNGWGKLFPRYEFADETR